MAKLAINGGSKACDHAWPTWPVWGDAERNGLMEVLESGKWWYGQRVREFEEKFAAFQDARFGITATSGSTALEVALRALGVGAGDEVIIPPYTFFATAAAVVWAGATPVFADILPDTLCIDPADVERKITPRTRAIVPVHLAGHVADMDRLGGIARKHRLFIVEDACHSWGSKWKGKGSGALGNCGVFSFQFSKNICSGEGGIILTDDAKLAEHCRSLTNCGRVAGGAWYEHQMIGSNLRLTEFQASLLHAQFDRLMPHLQLRRRNALILNELLRRIPGVTIFEDDPRVTQRAYHLYCFRLDLQRLRITREQFLEALAAEGVPASGGYVMPLYRQPAFRPAQPSDDGLAAFRPAPGSALDFSQVECPITEQICREVCWLTHAMLLANEPAVRDCAVAIAKVCENAAELRSVSVSVPAPRRPIAATR